MAVNALILEHLQEAPLNAKQIARATRTDSELSKVHRFIMEGWPSQVEENLKAFHMRRNELSTEQNRVLRGTRVIVPTKQRKAVLRVTPRTPRHGQNEGTGMKKLAQKLRT